MGRKGKSTVQGTSVNSFINKLIDKYIEQNKRLFRLKQIKLSRAKVVEVAFLAYLDGKGVLEQYLKELDYSDGEVKSIKEHLKSVSGLSQTKHEPKG